jgi:hypothetical protein
MPEGIGPAKTARLGRDPYPNAAKLHHPNRDARQCLAGHVNGRHTNPREEVLCSLSPGHYQSSTSVHQQCRHNWRNSVKQRYSIPHQTGIYDLIRV